MPSGQVIALDTVFGNATVARTLRSSVLPEINIGFDLAILINAGRDIVLPGPVYVAMGQAPTGLIGEATSFLILEDNTTHLFLENFPGSLLLEGGTPIIGPLGEPPFVLVQPVPEVIVARPDGRVFTYVGVILGAAEDKVLHNTVTPVGVIEAKTLVRAIMPAGDLDQGGLYSAYLRFDTVSTALTYFFVKTGPPSVPPPVPGQPDFFSGDFQSDDFQTS